jgi:hypothetical protein
MYRCRGVAFKQGCRIKEGIDEAEVKIVQIVELARHTYYRYEPMDIEPMTPSITQYGTYTIGPPPRRRFGSTPTKLFYLQPTTNNPFHGTYFQPMRFHSHVNFT